jgi:hypothetical protein
MQAVRYGTFELMREWGASVEDAMEEQRLSISACRCVYTSGRCTMLRIRQRMPCPVVSLAPSLKRELAESWEEVQIEVKMGNLQNKERVFHEFAVIQVCVLGVREDPVAKVSVKSDRCS